MKSSFVYALALLPLLAAFTAQAETAVAANPSVVVKT